MNGLIWVVDGGLIINQSLCIGHYSFYGSILISSWFAGKLIMSAMIFYSARNFNYCWYIFRLFLSWLEKCKKDGLYNCFTFSKVKHEVYYALMWQGVAHKSTYCITLLNQLKSSVLHLSPNNSNQNTLIMSLSQMSIYLLKNHLRRCSVKFQNCPLKYQI